MKPTVVLNCVALLAGGAVLVPALAQATGGDPAMNVAAERSRIATQRAQQEERFAQAEVACYRRFAVFDCLRDARQVRRTALDALRRQEVVLNDDERKRGAAAAVQRIQDKLALPAHNDTP